MGAGGCRGYVYLQIKPSVLKEYLPDPFRCISAVKPWVQPSLYCVNLPSFTWDSISFIRPTNTPIHVTVCSARARCCRWWWQNRWKQMSLFSLSAQEHIPPPSPFFFFCETPQKNGGIKETTQSQKEKKCSTFSSDRGQKRSGRPQVEKFWRKIKIYKRNYFKSMDNLKMYLKYLVCLKNPLYI